MRLFIFMFLSGLTVTGFSQIKPGAGNNWYHKIFESRYVQQLPVYAMGVDSARRYYFNHFSAIDSLLKKSIAHGDTVKYLRVYFSFVIDKYGFITDPHFIRIASTRYAKSLNAKTVLYFIDDDMYYEKVVKQMLRKMSSWKPAMQDGIPVACRVEDYFEIWIGLSPPL